MLRSHRRVAGLAAAVLALAAGCARPPVPRLHFHWWAGCEAPAFDPLGAPDPLRASLARLLTRALVATDSLGRPALDAAERVAVSSDRRTYTFTLRPELRFVDGRPCSSAVFRAALLGALARTDHGTAAWRLAAVRGVEAIRPRKPLPAIAVTAPDPGTLVIELSLPDSLLLEKLAMPGASSAWEGFDPAPDWKAAVGLGPYRVTRSDARALTMVRARGAGPDTVSVRFGSGAARARTVLRGAGADLLWPLPPGLLDQPLPAGWALHARAADPERRLSLVFRADVPPTTRLAARRVLAHGIQRSELPRRLGAGTHDVGEWIPGAGRADLPGPDQAQLEAWLDRGKLGRSLHVTMAYDADGAGAAVARGLQGDWARFGLYVELRPLRGEAFRREALSGTSQVLLVEEQGLVHGAPGILAASVMPLRGAAAGSFRTGWRTREFDPWILPRRTAVASDPRFPERRMEEETVVLPLAGIDWVWIARDAGPAVEFHPRLGPSPALGPEH